MTVNTIERLTRAGIKPSYQRVKILEYLLADDRHPTAEQVHLDLKDRIPTLSKATVYNTLHAFVDKGLIRALSTDKQGTRYDFATDGHGHFVCLVCDRIYDFPHQKICHDDLLQGFDIHSEEVVLKGICEDCSHKKSKNK